MKRSTYAEPADQPANPIPLEISHPEVGVFVLGCVRKKMPIRLEAARALVYAPAKGWRYLAWEMPGRNEACPCVSGLKYKKCCGNN